MDGPKISVQSFASLTRNRTRRRMNEQLSAWTGAVDGLSLIHARLCRVVILNRPAVDVITSPDGPNTLFYLDQPYVHETRQTIHALRIANRSESSGLSNTRNPQRDDGRLCVAA